MNKFGLQVLGILLLSILVTRCEEENLYDILNVRRSATQKEIKQAYKKLARELHPDKSDDPDATTKFTKINEAYETLGDPEKRREYDDFGYTAANQRQPRQQRRGRDFHGFAGFDPFDGFPFHFEREGDFGGGESIIDKHQISLREYTTTVFPNSNKKPCILYFFTDFCFSCMRIEGILEKYFQELTSVGVCAATVHARRAADLTAHVRVINVPAIIGVVNERITQFSGPVNTQNLREFTRGLFPHNLITKLTNKTFGPFLDGWVDNRVRGIFFNSKEDIPTRFLAPAFFYKENVAFGIVYIRDPDASGILRKYNINKNRETFLMFNEDINSPVATISMLHLSRATLDEVIEGNKHLALPRLSSQAFFEELCPEEFKVKRRKLCVVLITKKSNEDQDEPLNKFRKYSQKSSLYGNSRIQFTYIYEDTQRDFVNALTKGKHMEDPEDKLKVAILWRVEKHQLKYEWLETGWSMKAERLCTSALERRLDVLLTTDTIMPLKTTPPSLFDENGKSLLIRIGYKLLHWGDKIMGLLYQFDSTAYITFLLTLTFVCGMSYFMFKLASLEEIQVQNAMPQKTHPRPPSRTFDEKSLKLYELDYRSYAELVSEADTGLTITLLVDKDSKDQLVKQFVKIVHPYSRYSALTFAFMQLEYNITWYRTLLEESVEDIKLENINIRNCVGTVLALNGYRKYFYIYSAKRGRQFIRKRNNVSRALGLDEIDENSDDDVDKAFGDYFFLDELLDGLAMWLDKIFDGSIPRIRLSKWPEMSG